MKTIFLDIDGVLTCRKTGWRFSTEALIHLHELLKNSGAAIVITSSWREENLKKTLLRLPALITENTVAQTPNLPGKTRGEQIRAWLEENPCKSFVILDDETDEYDEMLKLRLVHTDMETGLDEHAVSRAADLLEHP